MTRKNNDVNRRKFLRNGLWAGCLAGLAATGGVIYGRKSRKEMVWQIDPDVCVSCGNCATYCVLEKSAVKCVQLYSICGYCNLCFGYLVPEYRELNTGAENELCPTGAIERNFIEDPYYEYNIDEELCIGCAKCVKACAVFGNGSFFLQVRHDRCLNCNECSIAAACPSGAFKRVPADKPYLLKEVNNKG
ncbi:MAG: ferredoxin [Planctomycetota bacterium]|nr:MAG: ferredoxin [Planctomycetota bacterium]